MPVMCVRAHGDRRTTAAGDFISENDSLSNADLKLKGETMSDQNHGQDPENPAAQGGQEEQPPYGDTKDTDLASALDRQPISPKTGRELQDLQSEKKRGR